MATPFSRYEHAAILAPEILQDDYLSLRKADPGLDFHCYTREQVASLLGYQSDSRAILFLLQKGYSYEEATRIAAACCLLKKGTKLPERLAYLRTLQESLLQAGLLYSLPSPEKSFEGHPLWIAGYQDGLSFTALIGNLHNLGMGYDLVERGKAPESVYHFSDIYEELRYLYNAIGDDLRLGTRIESIYVLGLDQAYDDILVDFNARFPFQIEETSNSRIFDQPIYRRFCELLADGDEETALANLGKEQGESPLFPLLEKAILRYRGVYEEKDKQRELYDQLAKSLEVPPAPYAHLVRRLQEPIAPKGAHVYLVNFSMGVFPKAFDEDPLLFDEGSAALGQMTSDEKSQENASELNALLDSGKVVFASYKSKAGAQLYFLSGLAAERGMLAQEPPALASDYSLTNGALMETSLLDLRFHYQKVDPRLPSLLQENPLPSYRSYDASYTPFIPSFAAQKNSYSPTSLKKYYGCPFSYYLDKFLAIKEEDTPWNMRLGLIFHKVLQELYEPAFDFETSWAKALSEEAEKHGPWLAKEEALFIPLKSACFAAVSFYQKHEASLQGKDVSCEGHFTLPLPENPSISLEGQYDKIVRFGAERSYFVIVDYKTGGERFDEELLPYGLSLQLPFYAYYAFHTPSLENSELVGLFIGPILPSGLFKKKAATSLEKFEQDKFKIDGVFLKDPEKLAVLDPSFRKSDFIKGLAVSSKGFYPYSLARAKTSEDFASFADQAESLLLKADQAIHQGIFPIAPIVYKNNKYNACQFCPGRDICYREEDAVRHLPEMGGPSDDDDKDEEEVSDEEGES